MPNQQEQLEANVLNTVMTDNPVTLQYDMLRQGHTLSAPFLSTLVEIPDGQEFAVRGIIDELRILGTNVFGVYRIPDNEVVRVLVRELLWVRKLNHHLNEAMRRGYRFHVHLPDEQRVVQLQNLTGGILVERVAR